MDWKPFVLGKYEAMEIGEECDIHRKLKMLLFMAVV
jgi:hypothetical protein